MFVSGKHTHPTAPDRSWRSAHQVAAVRPAVSLTQAFGVELLATFLVVFTTLATLDPVREDVGCKALSIGLAYGVGTLFAVSASFFLFFSIRDARFGYNPGGESASHVVVSTPRV